VKLKIINIIEIKEKRLNRNLILSKYCNNIMLTFKKKAINMSVDLIIFLKMITKMHNDYK